VLEDCPSGGMTERISLRADKDMMAALMFHVKRRKGKGWYDRHPEKKSLGPDMFHVKHVWQKSD